LRRSPAKGCGVRSDGLIPLKQQHPPAFSSAGGFLPRFSAAGKARNIQRINKQEKPNIKPITYHNASKSCFQNQLLSNTQPITSKLDYDPEEISKKNQKNVANDFITLQQLVHLYIASYQRPNNPAYR
jgi:hypothetical protein